jgi:CheY-like chemotaxis protein
VPRCLNLLHVEDDRGQRLLIAHYLEGMKPELTFSITAAESEEDALRAFENGGFDFVIVDYHLTQGNGLSCLCELRRRDPVVPILAISGEATEEIAAQLVQGGADDYIRKDDLTSKHLAQSVRSALARADAFRHYQIEDSSSSPPVNGLLERICQDFAGKAAGLLAGLGEFETAARQAHLTPGQMQRLFDKVSAQIGRAPGGARVDRALLRPILLEILLRLYGQSVHLSSR